MSVMKMHYSTATPPAFPMPRNLFFSNLDEVKYNFFYLLVKILILQFQDTLIFNFYFIKIA